MGLFLQFIWLFMYAYYIFAIGKMEQSKLRVSVFIGISVFVIVLSDLFNALILGWIIVTLIFILYDLFYDDERFRYQWWKVATLGILITLGEYLVIATGRIDRFIIGAVFCYYIFLMLSQKRGYLKPFNVGVVTAFYSILIIVGYVCDNNGLYLFTSLKIAYGAKLICFLISVLLLILLEGTLISYQNGYEMSIRLFQQNALQNQYEEIKNIYLNMRGWRHDYHNHLQVIKAQIKLKKWEEVISYLNELEIDLDKVDIYVKSGNHMVDAILNSKLSLAVKAGIKIECHSKVPSLISVIDIDLCVILGNLLDNAIEACEKIDTDKRFLRIYMVVNKKQLYISIQNSAKEELDFNEKHYISNKRGNHGFGMKRVKLLVDKYDGFLNLQNEPGIFAVEVTLPIT